MKRENRMAAAGIMGLLLPAFGWAEAAARPKIDVVFVLDTTGSMGGLIEGAKMKSWSIANEIAKGKPIPQIRMGLVAYRDKTDDYVTKVFDLTANLDQMYKDLFSLTAGGGGDGPEHVLKALEAAIERISWSKDGAFRVVYLVGDAPPHEDYKDTPALSQLLEKAVRKGLIVNAVQCGTDPQTTAVWQKVARLGEGKFLAIPQSGGMVAVATPFDERMADLSRRLEGTLLAYGARRREALEERSLAASVSGMVAAMAPVAAERALFKSRAGFSSDKDLASAVEEGRADFATLTEDELPDELKGLSTSERKERLERVLSERKRLKAELDSLSEKRAKYLAQKAKEGPKGDSFDHKLVESLKAQAASRGITY